VTTLAWLPDNSSFISAGMDRKIILWDVHGKQRDSWGMTHVCVTDLAVTPDMCRVVALGMHYAPAAAPTHDGAATPPLTPAPGHAGGVPVKDNRMIIYDCASKQGRRAHRRQDL
jgi:WD40 repeat protein